MSFDPFNIGNVPVGGPVPFFILGPCALESEAFAWEMARALKEIADRTGIHFLFKASFDKANRTSVDSFRGPGPAEGCRILGEIAKELGVPVTTDIHTAAQADIAAEHVDLLQIPAFLCRQTDLLEAAAKTGRAVNVKKGQFLAPWDTVNIAGKLRAFGCERFLLTERGTTFGYNNLVTDMRSLYWMRKEGLPVVFDATPLGPTPRRPRRLHRRRWRTGAGPGPRGRGHRRGRAIHGSPLGSGQRPVRRAQPNSARIH
jgi:2-dehydro-3-deoxyphosphooctonate aldolase (KDO 8-P synthase)